MAYEQGNIPDLRSENRPRRFSWKALVVLIVVLAFALVLPAAIAGWI